MENSKNLLIRSLGGRALNAAIPKYLFGTLLDIGCGEKPLASMAGGHVQKHIALDHPGSQHDTHAVDVFASAFAIPLAESSVDSVLCTAVLEHLEEPETAIGEAFRVLKPGGRAIYTVPFIWHLHEEPRDFYRFTKYGLRYLFEKKGFRILELNALSGFWVTFLQLLVYKLFAFNRGPLRYIPVIPILGLVFQGIGYILNRLDPNEKWTWAYLIAVEKPA